MICWPLLAAAEVQTIAAWLRVDALIEGDGARLFSYLHGVASVFMTLAIWLAVLRLYDTMTQAIEARR